MQWISGLRLTWLRALLTFPTIVQGRQSHSSTPRSTSRSEGCCLANFYHCLWCGSLVRSPQGQLQSIGDRIYIFWSDRRDYLRGASRCFCSSLASFPVQAVHGLHSIHEIAKGRNDRIKRSTGSFGMVMTRSSQRLILGISSPNLRSPSRRAPQRHSVPLLEIRARALRQLETRRRRLPWTLPSSRSGKSVLVYLPLCIPSHS